MTKTVLVTGVSRGLGLATVERLLADKTETYRVVGLSRTLSKECEALVAGSGGRFDFVTADIGDLDAIPTL